MIGWTNLWIDGRTVVSPELNRRRALIVLGKIDEILAWEQTKEHERDERFVELGQYLCEVRAGQYWRLENLKSFDEFLEKRFPESRRKAYYLLAIHEHLTRDTEAATSRSGLDEGERTGEGGASRWNRVRLCTLGAQGEGAPEGRVQTGSGALSDRQGNGALGNYLFQALQGPVGGGRACA